MTDLRTCVDCIKEGVTKQRFAPYPGPRCAIHQGQYVVDHPEEAEGDPSLP